MTDKTLLTDRLNYAEALAHNLRPALEDRVQRLQDVRARIQELDGITCTGKNRSAMRGSNEKVYADHGTNVECPLHGKPAVGKRINKYIGNNPDKIAAVIQAQEWHAELVDLRREERSLSNVVKSTLQQLKRIYLTIDAEPPRPENGDTHLLYG